MSTRIRLIVGIIILGFGVVAQGALDKATETTRPALRADLNTIPLQLGEWIGRDEPMDPEILERTQATDYLNRIYINPKQPDRPLKLWINYSQTGLNLRHSPEVCLPSGGWSKVEPLCRTLDIERPTGSEPVTVMRLGYSQGDMVQGVGFWYYIFGEGRLERYVRSLPITSRSSHGRTTRGSGLTVEVFSSGEGDLDGATFREFAASVLQALDPVLPLDRAQYHIP